MNLSCPIPFSDTDRILLGHGSGGVLTHRLISDVFYRAFANPLLEQDHDGCVFPVEKGRLACSTDSFVVNPVFFPGGNIGDLAVNGTVNDLACCGAKPLYLTAGFIMEEGLLLSDLQRIVDSMKKAADKAGVQIITGDTKVVERGKCDQIFINTAGIGVVEEGVNISPRNAAEGDAIICSGPIGIHGITILSAREGLEFETTLESDSASLNKMIGELVTNIRDIHVLRDATRGGLSSSLNEIAQTAGVEMELDESSLVIPEAVRAASEMLGLDPLYIANEGVVLVILPQRYVEQALLLMRNHPEGRQAVVIGKVTNKGRALVRIKSLYGGYRVINTLNGEQLPRIC
jgi:hydrogenase expression/formation protein HypE